MSWDAWLGHSVEHAILDLGIVFSSLMLGVELTFKKKKKGEKIQG